MKNKSEKFIAAIFVFSLLLFGQNSMAEDLDKTKIYVAAQSNGSFNIIDHQYSVVFGGPNEEMLRISKDAFYVRGVKIDQDKAEAKKVYDAFIYLINGRCAR